MSEYFNISSYLILFVDYHCSTSFRYYVSIALVRASSGAGELTEVLEDPTIEKKQSIMKYAQVRRIAQFFRIMRIVRIFKVKMFVLRISSLSNIARIANAVQVTI